MQPDPFPPSPPSSPQPPQTPPAGYYPSAGGYARPSWWSRNWKWFLPLGCVGSLLLLAAFVGMIVTFVFGVMKSSDVYKTALARAQADPRVTQALGSPINGGMFLAGSIKVNGAGGYAELAIPISGPQGDGTIQTRATKENGTWNYSKLQVLVKNTGETIDLLARPRTDRPDLRANGR